MHSYYVLSYVLLISMVNCKNTAHRDPRFIRNAHTKTLTETHIVTSLIPSSCVYVDATLPPCRSVRYLKFPNFASNESQQEDNRLVQPASDSAVQSTPLGWGEYFGIYAPTVTVTQTNLQTKFVEDPRIVVTFAVRGCRPLRIPGDLNRCPQETVSTPAIQEILPTSTVAVSPFIATTAPVTPTNQRAPKILRNIDDIPVGNTLDSDLKNINEVNHFSQHVESSSQNIESFESSKSTEALPF